MANPVGLKSGGIRTPGASKGSPSDAKCVAEIVGEIRKLRAKFTFLFQGKMSALNFKVFRGWYPGPLLKEEGQMGRGKGEGEVASWLSRVDAPADSPGPRGQQSTPTLDGPLRRLTRLTQTYKRKRS